MFGPGIYMFIREAAVDNFLGDLPVTQGTYLSIVHQGNHFSETYFK